MALLALIRRLRRSRAADEAVVAAYAAIVAQARSPDLYRRLGVPDTPEGRLELVLLHAFLVLRRLRATPASGGEPAGGGATRDFGQALFDVLFQDLDQNLRVMGVGEMVVGKRVKRLVKGFYGRIALYGRALDESSDNEEEGRPPAIDPLAAALAETVYDGAGSDSSAHAEALAGYVRQQAAALEALPRAEILAGRLRFPAVADALPSETGVS